MCFQVDQSNILAIVVKRNSDEDFQRKFICNKGKIKITSMHNFPACNRFLVISYIKSNKVLS